MRNQAESVTERLARELGKSSRDAPPLRIEPKILKIYLEQALVKCLAKLSRGANQAQAEKVFLIKDLHNLWTPEPTR